jgi:hypothetical protein
MRRIIGLAIVVVLVAALWTGAWLWGASQIGAVQQQLAAADGVTSPKVTCASFAVSGFPFGFDVTCANVSVTYGDTTVTAAGLQAQAEVYNPFFVLVSAKSPATVADAFSGSQSRVDFGAANASVRLDPWRIARVSVVVDQPVWTDTVVEDQLIAKATHLEAHLIDEPDKHDAKAGLASLAQYAEIDGLSMPANTISNGKLTYQGEVSNLSDDVRTYGNPDVLKRWQAAGGVFTLKSLTGTDGDKTFVASGDAKLDAAGHVDGHLKITSKGVVEVIGPLIPDAYRGLLTGSPAADGSYSQTINIAAGLVFVGLVPVGSLPPLF